MDSATAVLPDVYPREEHMLHVEWAKRPKISVRTQHQRLQKAQSGPSRVKSREATQQIIFILFKTETGAQRGENMPFNTSWYEVLYLGLQLCALGKSFLLALDSTNHFLLRKLPLCRSKIARDLGKQNNIQTSARNSADII